MAVQENQNSKNEQRKIRLINANCGSWESIFVRIGSSRDESERFPCHLSVIEDNGLIEAQLTYKQSGKIARSAFREIPDSMQIEAGGHWSLGPQFLTQEFWTTEFCLCRPHERRRAIVRQSRNWLESIVVIVEWRTGHDHTDLLLDPQHPIYLNEFSSENTSTFEVMSESVSLGLELTIFNTPKQQATTWTWDSSSITRLYGTDNQLVREQATTRLS